MFDDRKPIIFNCPPELNEIEIYPIHDIHYGNNMFNHEKWNKLKSEILEQPNRYCVIAGDMMENAVPGSKSDVFYQTDPPAVQQEWVCEQLSDLKERIIGIIPGNHETNRSTKLCGIFPLYDCAVIAGLKSAYRQNFAVIDIGVGTGGHEKGRQQRYVGYVCHKAKDNKNYHSSDYIEGIDFFIFGHDHDSKDHARSRLYYDPRNHSISVRNVEVINNGSFLRYGDYAATSAYRPPSGKFYKLVLNGKHKEIRTVGFFP